MYHSTFPALRDLPGLLSLNLAVRAVALGAAGPVAPSSAGPLSHNGRNKHT